MFFFNSLGWILYCPVRKAALGCPIEVLIPKSICEYKNYGVLEKKSDGYLRQRGVGEREKKLIQREFLPI